MSARHAGVLCKKAEPTWAVLGKYLGAGPSSFGRHQRLSEIAIEPLLHQPLNNLLLTFKQFLSQTINKWKS